MDPAAGGRTRQAFIDRFADKDVLIIGSHFNEPTSGWIVSDRESPAPAGAAASSRAWKLKI
jgi:hypothetical protein